MSTKNDIDYMTGIGYAESAMQDMKIPGSMHICHNTRSHGSVIQEKREKPQEDKSN